jgi:two-component system sensor kinase FixL
VATFCPYPTDVASGTFEQPLARTRDFERLAKNEPIDSLDPCVVLMTKHLTKMLDRRYWIALTVIAMLVLGNEMLIQPFVTRLTTDAPLINTAGRQRMLSQRLAKAALAFQLGKGLRAKAYLEEMKQVLDLWSASHRQLLRSDARSWPGFYISKHVHNGLVGLEPHFLMMETAAARMIRAAEADHPDVDTVREQLAVILDNEAEYLGRMDRVVGLYEQEARRRVDSLGWFSWAITSMTLAILAAIGWFILRPAAGLIRRQVFELRQSRDDLETRVRERTQELEAAVDRHRTLVEQFSHVARTSTLGEMASALAHELKQPLGAIANYAEGCLIALNSREPALEEVRSALERLLAATMRSGRIIEQVRRFVTRQGPTHESFDPNHVVREVMEILGVEAQQRGVAVELDLAPDLPSLQGDPVQIQQVVVNLVQNAFEALVQSQTPKPGLVLSTRMAEFGDVEIAVSDNGEGIPPDRLSQVFDAYFSTRARGMGMGLAISRTIVEAHQGRFFVESDPGVKTTFRFLLPATCSDHEQPDGLHRG